MDVAIPEIPSSYDAFRERVARFIDEHRPAIEFAPRAGMRVPDEPDDVARLRSWVRTLHDAGLSLSRFA